MRNFAELKLIFAIELKYGAAKQTMSRRAVMPDSLSLNSRKYRGLIVTITKLMSIMLPKRLWFCATVYDAITHRLFLRKGRCATG